MPHGSKLKKESVERLNAYGEKLHVHYDIYIESLYIYKQKLKRARQIIFSEIVNKDINNTCTLFAVVDRLANPSPSVTAIQ